MARPASLMCSRGVASSSSTCDLREPERGETMARYGGSQLGAWMDTREEDDTIGAKVGALDGGDVGKRIVARTIHQGDKCQWKKAGRAGATQSRRTGTMSTALTG